MRLPVLFISFSGLIIVESALLITSPWLYLNRKTFKSKGSASAPDLTVISELNEVPETKCPLTIKIPSSDSLKSSISSSKGTPRVYTRSSPIPILQTQETNDRIRLDKLRKSLSFNNDYQEIRSDSDDSDTSDSSTGSSIASSPEMFIMSFVPEYAKIIQLEKEEREKAKVAKKIKRKEDKLAKEKGMKLNSGHYFTEEEENEFRDAIRERSQCFRISSANDFVESRSSNSNVETDSDFGSAAKGDCYSLSF